MEFFSHAFDFYIGFVVGCIFTWAWFRFVMPRLKDNRGRWRCRICGATEDEDCDAGLHGRSL
jgi:hypothetical protein